MLKKIKSELVFLVVLIFLVGLGFIKVVIPTYPHEPTMWGIITLTLSFFGKRLIQKRPNFRGHGDGAEYEEDI